MITSTTMTCPRAQADLAPLAIDMSDIYRVEARIDEVAIVTPQKAPELLATFNRAYAELYRWIPLLEKERSNAERQAMRVRAIVLLDKAPGILKEKGLTSPRSPSGSEDLREAVLAQDQDYQQALDVAEQIKCVAELLKGKLKSFEMAYTSVKKIMGEASFGMLGHNGNLSGGMTADSNTGAGLQVGYGFGKPRY